MKYRFICTAVLGCFVMAGCGSKQDANEKNFGAAIGQYLDKKGELCLRLNKWPVDVSEMDLTLQKNMPTGTAGQMQALAAVGLAIGADAEVEQLGGLGLSYNKPTARKFKVKRYVLTDAGQKFYREKEVDGIGLQSRKQVMQGDICYGKKALDKVVKWEGPMKFGDYQEANVKYLYKIENLPDWTKNNEFLSAFPYVGQIIEAAGKKEQQGGVKLTSQGWEPKGLD